jgi:hypothetical protein
MNTIFHFLINIIIAILLKLNLVEILLVGFGGVLIDIDHIFYMIFGEKIYSFKKAAKFSKKEFKLMRPHFFFLHFVEVIGLLLVISYLVSWYALLIFFGFLLHWIFDALKYIYVYKSFSPWIRYYSLIAYFIAKK